MKDNLIATMLLALMIVVSLIVMSACYAIFAIGLMLVFKFLFAILIL